MLITNKYCKHDPHYTLTVKTLLGKMAVYDAEKYKGQAGIYCPGQDDVSRTLINTGMWEKTLVDRIIKILDAGERGNLVADVGSHIGWYSKMAENLGYMVNSYDAVQEHLALSKINAPSATQYLKWFDEKTTSDFEINQTIELLKIDIEGSEQHAIRYFEPSLRLVKNILIEVSPVFNDSYPTLIENLKRKGFDILEIDGSQFNFKYNFKQKDLWLKKQL